ncbi:beta-ketoacyl-ACP synthase [Psittacicella gerlachiana]|uniref:Beta-ketoacyl-[acyl-carrier-protein] synthase II n=1 Tax=Psittacicella gerlachiana TaxID=2028574 RepID=A0A3A1YF07_9GAMM|nr:beta-ketoacyl-ACP synthase [Psittacicella gerlachiana]RIY36823.1 beta-ketoacyl-[acyl-carrier-protein] synthase II [Psittacicella gerlachiana]
MQKIYLHKPALLSCLGQDLEEHLQALFQATSGLQASDNPFADPAFTLKPGVFGQVKQELRPFPSHLKTKHYSRTNHLLWHALATIEEQIKLCLRRYSPHRIAVIMGTSTSGIDELIPYFKHDLELQNFNEKDLQLSMSAPADFVKEVYELQGLTYAISTACTSGARALISGARFLNNNLCDAVIVGGVDNLSPLTVKGFESLSVLAEQQLNPCSLNRSGTNIGEGAAVFIMTREPLDNQTLLLLGYGATSDAYHISSPHPQGKGANLALTQALKQSKLTPEQIGWINLHGTGTKHNDLMESTAIASVLGLEIPCTSTKASTGHTLGAAGAIEAALLWGIISRDYNPQGKLPPQIWDQELDAELAPLTFTNEQSTWLTPRRIGLSNSFAFGGNNTVLIIGEDHAN